MIRNMALYNDLPLQGLTSDVCGDYCLFYLLQRTRNLDLKAIQAKFKIKDSQWNDTQVAQFVHRYISTLGQVKHSSMIQCNNNQRCQTYQCCRKKLMKYC